VFGRVSSPVFVGRAAELAQLEAMLRRTVAGGSATAVVSGDAGVGKTRLAAELINRCEAQGVVALVGACLDVGDGVLPYAPIADALRRAASLLTEADLDRVLGEARAYLTHVVPEFRIAARAGSARDVTGWRVIRTRTAV
jgi:predicted ATPase